MPTEQTYWIKGTDLDVYRINWFNNKGNLACLRHLYRCMTEGIDISEPVSVVVYPNGQTEIIPNREIKRR